MAEPGPKQNFPQIMTAIVLAMGDWIVVSVRAEWHNLTNYHIKLNDFEQYEWAPLPKRPFNKDKGANFKPDGIDDEKQYRGNNKPGAPSEGDETDDGSPQLEGDDFTVLYFQQNKKGKDEKDEGREAAPIFLEFGQIGEAHQGSGIAYYVWPTDNGDPVFPYFPAPDKDQAKGPPPEYTWPYLGGPEEAQKKAWVAIYNTEFSWYETWSPGLRWQMGNQIGFARFDALKKPDGPNFGWYDKADRDAFLAAWNDYVAPLAGAPGAYHDFWPLPPYFGFEIDWSQPTDPNGDKSSAKYTVDAWRIRANNIPYDDANKLLVKKFPTGKNHAQYIVNQGQPADKVRLKITWNAKDGLAITTA